MAAGPAKTLDALRRSLEGGRASALALWTALSAAVALTTPLWAAEPDRAAGWLLLGGVVAELVQSFNRKTRAAQRQAWASAGYTLLLALVLLNTAWLAATALSLFLAVPFVLDALNCGREAVRQASSGQPFRRDVVAGVGHLAAAAGVLLLGRYATHWVVAVAAGVRLLTVTVNIATAATYSAQDAGERVIADLGLDQAGRLGETGARLQAEEVARAAADRGWIAAIVAVLFAIHVSRMGFDKSALGVLSPLVAVVGDMVVALALAYLVHVPLRLFARRLTRPLERRGWAYVLDTPAGGRIGRWCQGAIRWGLESRLRFAIRLREARYSLASAFGRGLQLGLPLAAVIVASVPIWGMSWYFDTENWAASVWNSWAAQRTDRWRGAMVRAVVGAGQTTLDAQGFMVAPEGVDGAASFSFIVIGDTGEGDASQHVLRDSLLRAASASDVRFVVLSSDVVYPTGAMRDYEARFWLPFKGVTKPLYAIPGNHDWYDALEGFVATFLQPDAARAAMRARIAEDGGLSSTTDARIEEYIDKAGFLRQQYGVPTGQQQAPFFQIQTPQFALLAVDTGVLRGVDADQLTWLRAALARSRGKMVMAVLGHPFLAGGHDVARGDAEFTALRDLFRAHDVRVIMAGDTHDLEYYQEADGPAGAASTHHWVNGGGGAYLSFGTSLAWPGVAATAEWAYYPGRSDVVDKINASTPLWKWPAWVWTRRFGAWPSSAEWLSAMFDYNVAPFFQSFVVVTVDPAARRLTIRPWGVHGPLTWRDFDRSARVMPPGATPDHPVEWTVP